VAVAAEGPLARMRIQTALEGRADLAVSAGASAIELVASGAAADAIIVHCPALRAAELAVFAELRQRWPELPIVAICDSMDVRAARRAIDRGLDGLVFSDQIEVALEPTIAAVLAGQTAVPRELRSSGRAGALTFREKQVLGMVVMGFTNQQIGSRLFLAESTVKSHLSSVFAKLGARSRSEAAAMILDPNVSQGNDILQISSDTRSAPTPDAADH